MSSQQQMLDAMAKWHLFAYSGLPWCDSWIDRNSLLYLLRILMSQGLSYNLVKFIVVSIFIINSTCIVVIVRMLKLTYLTYSSISEFFLFLFFFCSSKIGLTYLTNSSMRVGQASSGSQFPVINVIIIIIHEIQALTQIFIDCIREDQKHAPGVLGNGFILASLIVALHKELDPKLQKFKSS